MNIGIDLRTLLNPLKTGVGEYASELITHILMSNRGHDFFLYYNAAFTASHLEVFTSFPHTHLVATHIPNKLMNSSTVLLGRPHIDRLIRRATGSTIDFFFSPNLNITALSPNMPHVLTIHDISYEFFPHFFSQKQRLWHKAVNPRALARQARAIITPSTHTAHDVCDYYNIDPTLIHVIPPGLATEFKTSLDKLSPNDITRITATYNLPARYLLFLGTIEPRKNIPTLIKAFEHYVNHYNDNENHLVIAGAPGWNSKAFYSALKTAKHTSLIHHIGYIKPEDKAALYRAATVFIYPSLYEGFGFPILEAMAAGTPVITSIRASLAEVAGNGALYCNPRDIQNISDCLHHLLTSERLRNTLSQAGLRQSQQFSYRTMADTWLNLAEKNFSG